MEELKGVLNDFVMEWLIKILTVVLTLLGTYITMYYKKLIALSIKKVESIESENERTLIKGAIDNLDKLILQSVTSLNETMVKGLKEANEDGKLTMEDINTIKNSIHLLVNSQITDATKEAVNKQLNDIDAYIEHQSELALLILKGKVDKDFNK